MTALQYSEAAFGCRGRHDRIPDLTDDLETAAILAHSFIESGYFKSVYRPGEHILQFGNEYTEKETSQPAIRTVQLEPDVSQPFLFVKKKKSRDIPVQTLKDMSL